MINVGTIQGRIWRSWQASPPKGNPYFFTGQRLDLDPRDAATREPKLVLYHYRARAYDALHGRFLQRDPFGTRDSLTFGGPTAQIGIELPSEMDPQLQYHDGMNLYSYALLNPATMVDPLGLWNAEVHKDLTTGLAVRAGMSVGAAWAVGVADDATDNPPYGFQPVSGDQSRHFDRSGGSLDTRLKHVDDETDSAEWFCNPRVDVPEEAAEHLGRGLHSLQDWFAHGQYSAGRRNTWIWHGTRFYDDWKGNWVAKRGLYGDARGRPLQWWPPSDPFHLGPDLPLPAWWWEKGTKRKDGTILETVIEIKRFLHYVRTSGGDACKCYFLSWSQ